MAKKTKTEERVNISYFEEPDVANYLKSIGKRSKSLRPVMATAVRACTRRAFNASREEVFTVEVDKETYFKLQEFMELLKGLVLPDPPKY